MAALQRKALAPLPTTEVYGPTATLPGRTTTTVSYGLPFQEAAAKHIAALPSADRIYIISSRTLANSTQYLSVLQSALSPKVVGTRIGLQSHTIWQECLSVAEDVRRVNATCILTLGGGSITDAAKFIAQAALTDLSTRGAIDPLIVRSAPSLHSPFPKSTLPSLPLIFIPTTLSAGEHTPAAGVTDGDTSTKYQLLTARATLIIYDPELALSTPMKWWLSTGMRGVDHCIETLCCMPEQTAPEMDDIAAKGLQLLLPGLLRAKCEPESKEARLDAQLGVALAIQPITAGVPMGASHGIGHMLGPMGVGHGETSCILLPAVCRYNASVHGERQEKVKKLLWDMERWKTVFEGNGLSEGTGLGDLVEGIVKELEMPGRLSTVGVDGNRVRKLAETSLEDPWLKTNPRPLSSVEEVMEILNTVR